MKDNCTGGGKCIGKCGEDCMGDVLYNFEGFKGEATFVLVNA